MGGGRGTDGGIKSKMVVIGLSFPFITYGDMCNMEISELNGWYEDAKTYQEELKEARGG